MKTSESPRSVLVALEKLAKAIVEQTQHDRTVRQIAEFCEHSLKGYGVIVSADLKDWSGGQPPEINGYRPDVYVKIDDGGELVVEVETVASMNEEHALAQLTAFEKWRSEDRERRFVVRRVAT